MKHFFHYLDLFDISQISDILNERVPKKGKNKTEVAKSLGISSQLLGQYMRGRQEPKVDFYQAWKRVFKEDLLNISETNVPHSTNSGEGQNKVINEPITKALLEEKEARRRETEETLKIERERNDKLMALFDKHLAILQASSNKIDDQQGMILSVIRSDNTVILENLDLLLKHPKGTSATKSGNIQLAADSLTSSKGKLEGTGKKSK